MVYETFLEADTKGAFDSLLAGACLLSVTIVLRLQTYGFVATEHCTESHSLFIQALNLSSISWHPADIIFIRPSETSLY